MTVTYADVRSVDGELRSLMSFWGRTRELARLRDELDRVITDGAGRMVTLRGRRQVGKSTLLTKFVETAGLPYLFTTAVKNASPDVHAATAAADAATSRWPLPNAELALSATVSSWADFLRGLTLAVDTSPAVIVIDEFPWATESDPTLEGTLQAIWDQHLSAKPILLVLVGSDVAIMQRLTEHDRPLFGRAEDWVLNALTPAQVADALGNRDAMDAIDVYLATGGYPRMVLDAARHPDTRTYIADALQTDGSRLTVTGIRILDTEFRDHDSARAVLEAIGSVESGHATFSSTVANLAPDRAVNILSRTLPTLVDAKRVVAIDVPVGAKPTTKLRRYRITDPYLRFWLRYCQPHLPAIARGRGDIAVAAFDRDFSSWRGRAVEPVIHDAISQQATTNGRLADVVTVGTWWDRTNQHEYDVVGANRRGTVLIVGTVKWRQTRPVTAGDIAALTKARAIVPRAAGARLLAVCPAGIQTNAAADVVIDADGVLDSYR
ncbi:MAG: ATP-binding protein [Euzebya sp.]